MQSLRCSSCSQSLDNLSKWRLPDSTKLLCDNCASRGDTMERCVSCSKAFPDHYYNRYITVSNNNDGPPPSVIGHACCVRRLTDWSGSIKDHYLSSTHDRHVVKDVLGVRLRKSEWDKKVRIRWEDSWKPSDWEDRHKEAKCIVEWRQSSKKIRWKDTWEPLRYMDDGKLK